MLIELLLQLRELLHSLLRFFVRGDSIPFEEEVVFADPVSPWT